MRRKNILLTILVLFGLLLAACGSATANTTDNTIVNDTASNTDSGIVNTSAQTNVVQQETAVTDEIVTTQTYINLYNHLNPSVVNIQVVSEGTAIDLNQFRIVPDPENPDETLPEDLPDDFHQELETIPQESQGSGFVYDKEGHIITNNHVVADAIRVTVIFSDDTEADAEIVGTDPGSDLAVIKVDVDPDRLHPVTIGDSDNLQVGQLVATIGNPFGLSGSMSTGIISGLGRLLPGGASAPGGTRFNIPDIIQTDAAVNPGNSGGPLLNLSGEVIGVNTAIQTNGATVLGTTPTFGGISYVVPSNIVAQVVPQLIENGEISYPWLGISGTTLSDDLAQAMELPIEQNGVLVYEVIDGSPADEAGLQGSETQVTIDGFNALIGGDVIVQMNDELINDFDDLLTYIVRRTSVGQTVTLQILRGGELQEIEITLQARPE
ncbi:MAG: trypsin-like peptidase domain-containing protein [Ardenticatenaceae bacterium]|nr:trypsin-like peptidase domain-containing protein [Ardenticatenaceae bacterium]